MGASEDMSNWARMCWRVAVLRPDDDGGGLHAQRTAFRGRHGLSLVGVEWFWLASAARRALEVVGLVVERGVVIHDLVGGSARLEEGDGG